MQLRCINIISDNSKYPMVAIGEQRNPRRADFILFSRNDSANRIVEYERISIISRRKNTAILQTLGGNHQRRLHMKKYSFESVVEALAEEIDQRIKSNNFDFQRIVDGFSL